jgi:hypothetical protein
MILHLAHIRLTDARTFITLTSLKMGGQFAPREGELYPLADRKSRFGAGVRKFGVGVGDVGEG